MSTNQELPKKKNLFVSFSNIVPNDESENEQYRNGEQSLEGTAYDERTDFIVGDNGATNQKKLNPQKPSAPVRQSQQLEPDWVRQSNRRK